VAELRVAKLLFIRKLQIHAEEEKGDKKFAEAIIQIRGHYVNDAFGKPRHRAHASTTIGCSIFSRKKNIVLLDSVAKKK